MEMRWLKVGKSKIRFWVL
jgi:hypothetical protein